MASRLYIDIPEKRMEEQDLIALTVKRVEKLGWSTDLEWYPVANLYTVWYRQHSGYKRSVSLGSRVY